MTLDTIINGDSVEVLNGWEPGCVDLAFADPPFNIGYVYDTYNDDKPRHEYVAWTRSWMAAISRVLKPTGAFFIAIGDDYAADVRQLGRELGLHLRNWIIWHYTFGQATKAKFARAHTHIFYFTKDAKQFTFNAAAVRYPSARHTEYQDLRASPDGRVPDDVWDDFPRVCGTFAEREGFHGCQMPEALLMRIVAAASNPGEVVLDPFSGSGTTAVAAQRLGRRYVSIDMSPEYVRLGLERLERTRAEDAAAPTDGEWPRLHVDMLTQIYRETKVALRNLEHNDVALRVIGVALRHRCGRSYEPEEIVAALYRLKAAVALPKLPNADDFTPREHVAEQGKKYVRRKAIQRARRSKDDAPALLSM